MDKHISQLYEYIKDIPNGTFIDGGFFKGEVTSNLINKLSTWKFYAFDINNEISFPVAKTLSEQYNNFLYRNVALYTKTDNIKWYKDSRPSKPNGSNIIGKGFGLAQLNLNNPMDIECIDFSEWIYNNLDKENYNVLKLDIEGAEYEVLNKLITTGAIQYIKLLCIEWHPQLNVHNISIKSNNLPTTITWV